MKKRIKNKQLHTDGSAERAEKLQRSPALTPEQIPRRAYEIYEARGREGGRELDDWLLAEYEPKAGAGRKEQNPTVSDESLR